MGDSTMDADVDSLCADVWAFRLAESPELATFCGFHHLDDLLDDISEEAYIKRENMVKEFKKKADAIDAKQCSKESRTSLLLLRDQLQEYLDGAAFKAYLFPISFMEGVHIDMVQGLQFMKFDTADDFEVYVSRLEKMPHRVEQVQDVLQKGIDSGMVLHRFSMEEVPIQLDKLITTPVEEHPSLQPFNTKDKKVSDEQLQKVKTKAMDIITSLITPAFDKLKKFIQEVYLKQARASECVCSLPQGIELYGQCLQFHLSCSMSPIEVHELGLKEVTRIQGLMKDLAKKEGYDRVFDYIKLLKTRAEGKFTSAEEALDYVKDLCYNKIQPKMSALFHNMPKDPLEIMPVPDVLANSCGAFYYAGTPNGSRAGVYYLNTSNLDLVHRYELTALSLHEAIPGHHLQAIYAINEKTLPDFRRYSEDSKYYLAPSRFSFNTAYTEGWGLYSEALGEEMGMYEDSATLMGRYCYEIFRAARLVVDTGIHAFGWSKHKAINYIVDQAMMDYDSVKNEVNRYITWPGQACAYKVGELKIWELRHKAEKELRHKFDVRVFHETILKCGACSLRFLESIVNDYIAEVGPPTPEPQNSKDDDDDATPTTTTTNDKKKDEEKEEEDDKDRQEKEEEKEEEENGEAEPNSLDGGDS